MQNGIKLIISYKWVLFEMIAIFVLAAFLFYADNPNDSGYRGSLNETMDYFLFYYAVLFLLPFLIIIFLFDVFNLLFRKSLVINNKGIENNLSLFYRGFYSWADIDYINIIIGRNDIGKIIIHTKIPKIENITIKNIGINKNVADSLLIYNPNIFVSYKKHSFQE